MGITKLWYSKKFMQEKEKIKYKGKCIKMDERTWILFKKKRKESGLSWNLFLVELLSVKPEFLKRVKE